MTATRVMLVFVGTAAILAGCGSAPQPSAPPTPAIVADLARVAPSSGTAATVAFHSARKGFPEGYWTIEFPLPVNGDGAIQTAMEARVDALMASKGHPKDPVNGYPESLQAAGPIDPATGIADWTYLVMVDGLGPDGYPSNQSPTPSSSSE